MSRVSRRKFKKKIKRFFTFVLLIAIISLCLVIYFKNDEWEDDKKLNKFLSNEQIKEIKSNNDTELVMSLVDNSSFKKDNVDRYISYSKKSKLDTDKVIKLVNNDIDKLDDFIYDDIIFNLLDEEYYIYKNTVRYMSYYKDNTNLKAKEVVTNVNSNIDYAFYTHMKKTDLSKGDLILVNKYNYLDKDYEPELVVIDKDYGTWGSLTPVAYDAFKVMVDAAKVEGIKLYSISPYRSYTLQNTLYNRYGNRDGFDEADKYSARPGSSEHQTGLAIDINAADDWFDNTTEAKWLAKNAYKYGFILRYPKGKEYITGYQYESWHYRYVGKEIAKYIFEHDITFEEYYAYFIEK